MKDFGPSDDPAVAASFVAKDGAVAIQGGKTIAEPYIDLVLDKLKAFPAVDPMEDAIDLGDKGLQYCIYDLNVFSNRADEKLRTLLDSVVTSLTPEVIASRTLITKNLDEAYKVAHDAFTKIGEAHKAYVESNFPAASTEQNALYQEITEAQKMYLSAYAKYAKAHEAFRNYFSHA
jgi:hypothetical protein